MTRKLFGTVGPRKPAFTDTTRQPIATPQIRQLAADVRRSTGVRVEEYFAEDYMVDNHDYVYTAYPI